MIELQIVGTGGHGRELASIATAMLGDEVTLTFWDDAVAAGDYRFGRVAGSTADLIAEPKPKLFVIGIGDPITRATVTARLDLAGHMPFTLIHPTASIGRNSQIGEGSVVGPLSAITCDSSIGKQTHLHAGVVISHDCTLGDFILVTPGVSVAGDVTIHDEVWLGVGSTVNRGLTIHRGALVGAGAVVINDVAAGSVVAGVPARPLDADLQR